MARDKSTSAEEAVGRIPDGVTVAILGAGGGILEPDLLVTTLGRRYARTGHPRDLTLVYSAGLGDRTDRTDRGMRPLAQKGLVRRVVAGHLGMCPEMGRLIVNGDVEAYNLPLGVLSLLYRETAAGRPGLITTTGLGTFVDPRLGGGRLNDRGTADLVQVIELDGEEYLYYPRLPIDVALVRGSTADREGNLSLAEETSYLDAVEVAAAAHRQGGLVLAQAKRIVPAGALAPKLVQVPGMLVDAVIEHPGQQQTYQGEHNPGYAGLARVAAAIDPMPPDHRAVIARRAAREVRAGDVVNIGLGIPDGVATVLHEEGRDEEVTLTVEHGIVGGTTARGHVFGASVNHRAVIGMPTMIDLYHGGVLDLAFLGFAQVDQHGHVNVSGYGGTVTGVGGFIDITQHARRLVFCGTLTTGGLDLDHPGGAIKIRREGRIKKFVHAVDQVSFNGQRALARGQSVLYVTERAVFRLTPDGLQLTEVAPGVRVEQDVLAQCGFRPIVRAVAVLPGTAVGDRPAE